MASNIIPRSYDALVSLAEDAADGADAHGAAIGLAHNPAARIRADLVTLVGDAAATPPQPGRDGDYNAARSAKTAATAPPAPWRATAAPTRPHVSAC